MTRENEVFESLIHEWANNSEFPSSAALNAALSYMRAHPESFAPQHFASGRPDLIGLLLEGDPSLELIESALQPASRVSSYSSSESQEERTYALKALSALSTEKLLEVSSRGNISLTAQSVRALLEDPDPRRTLAGLALSANFEEVHFDHTDELTKVASWLCTLEESEARSLLAPLTQKRFPLALRLARLTSPALLRSILQELTTGTQLSAVYSFDDILIALNDNLVENPQAKIISFEASMAAATAVQVSRSPQQCVSALKANYPRVFESSALADVDHYIKNSVPLERTFSDGAPATHLSEFLSDYEFASYPRVHKKLLSLETLRPEQVAEIYKYATHKDSHQTSLARMMLEIRGPQWVSALAVELFRKKHLEDLKPLIETLTLPDAIGVFSELLDEVDDESAYEYSYALGAFAKSENFQDPDFMELLTRVFKKVGSGQLEREELVVSETAMLVLASPRPEDSHDALMMGIGQAADILGDDPKLWETFVALMNNFTGSIAELVEVTRKLQ